MADTGAPWNIPYVENADLVKDYPTDSLALANAIASGLDAAAVAGIGSNVVQATKTDTFSTTSTSFVPVTGVSVTITPSSATSKVLVIVSGVAGTDTTGNNVRMNLMRGATAIGQSTGSGTGDQTLAYKPATADSADSFSIVVLDSPASAAAQTYSLETATTGNTNYFNRPSGSDAYRSVTTITAIEVAA